MDFMVPGGHFEKGDPVISPKTGLETKLIREERVIKDGRWDYVWHLEDGSTCGYDDLRYVWTDKRAEDAAMSLFYGVGSDLHMEVEDPSDDAFQDWCGMMLFDMKVPIDMLDRVLGGFKR
jgi:hypothetical protein